MSQQPKITLLAGGVGGAKAAEGLVQSPYGEHVKIIGNIADDDAFHGLWVSPDIDTLTYSLANLIDRGQGWGLQGDGRTVLNSLDRLGADCWMQLGDMDFATHIYRTQRREKGDRPSDIAGDIAAAFGVRTPLILPTDDVIQTRVKTPDGWMSFQEYFVKNRCQPDIEKILFDGIEHATATSEAIAAILEADVIMIAPSNPIVSIGPILALPELRRALQQRKGYAIALSPLIGGKTVKGPADKMLTAQGYSSDNLGIAKIYHGLIDGLVIDHQDQNDLPSLREGGLQATAMSSLMQDANQKQQLMGDMVAQALTWQSEKKSEVIGVGVSDG